MIKSLIFNSGFCFILWLLRLDKITRGYLLKSFFVVSRETQYNFSLLLFRYLCHTRGRNEASRIYPSFVGVLEKLREMADILKNKTIKIWPTPTVEEYLDNFVLNWFVFVSDRRWLFTHKCFDVKIVLFPK